MKILLFLLTAFQLACSIGPVVHEKVTWPSGVVKTTTTFTGATCLTKSKRTVASIDPVTGKISYRTTGTNETSVPSQFLTSDFIRRTVVPIASP